MKILHYIYSLAGGGAEQQCLHLVRGLEEAGLTTGIVYFDPGQLQSLDNCPTRLYQVDRGAKWDIVGVVRRVMAAGRDFDPDIIHLWLPEIITFPGCLRGILSDAAIVSSTRRVPISPKMLRLWLRAHIGFLPHLFSDRLVVNFPITENQSPLFRGLTQLVPTEFIPNGLDVSSIQSSCQRANHAVQGTALVYCGRLVEEKRVEMLLRAAARIAERDLKIHVFGQGPKEVRLKELAGELGIRGNVVFHGYDSRWLELACSATALVHPSMAEGMSNSIMEALAAGLPVIATDLPENRHLIEDGTNGLLFERDSLDDLTEVIRTILHDSALRARLAEQGRRTASRYTTDRMVEQFLSVYEEVATSRS